MPILALENWTTISSVRVSNGGSRCVRKYEDLGREMAGKAGSCRICLQQWGCLHQRMLSVDHPSTQFQDKTLKPAHDSLDDIERLSLTRS